MNDQERITDLILTEKKMTGNYDTFAFLTGGGGATTQVVNKLINSKYNSVPGSYQQRGVTHNDIR